MKELKFIQLQKENEEHYKLFESLMIPYNKELDEHKNIVTPEDFVLKLTRGMLNMQGPYDRHLELFYDNENLIGFLYGKVDHEKHKGFIKPGYGYIMEFYVKPEFRHKGYGKAMFERLEDHFASYGTKMMYLTADPVTGKPFWEAMGFINTGVLSPENKLPIYEKPVRKLKIEQIHPPVYRATLLDEDMIIYVSEIMDDQNNLNAIHTNRFSFNEWRETFKASQNDFDEANFIICRDLIPYAWLKINGLNNPEMSWISMLVVFDRFKRQGAGTFAVEFAESFIRSKGKTKIGIHTTKDNIPAQNLYRKCGYSAVNLKEGTSPDGTKQMVYTFEKVLS